MNNTYEAGTEQAKQLTAKLLVANVQSVYSGKPHTCRCGCTGKYRYHPLMVEAAGRRRGYDLSAEEVNLSQVKKVVQLLLQHLEEVEVIENSDELIFDVELNGRVYTAYAPKAAA